MINCVRPVVITILARIFLKETFGLFEVINIAFSLIGVIFVMQPPFIFGNQVTSEHSQAQGHFYVTLVVFGGTVAVSIASVAMRALKVSPYTSKNEVLGPKSNAHNFITIHIVFMFKCFRTIEKHLDISVLMRQI